MSVISSRPAAIILENLREQVANLSLGIDALSVEQTSKLAGQIGSLSSDAFEALVESLSVTQADVTRKLRELSSVYVSTIQTLARDETVVLARKVEIQKHIVNLCRKMSDPTDQPQLKREIEKIPESNRLNVLINADKLIGRLPNYYDVSLYITMLSTMTAQEQAETVENILLLLNHYAGRAPIAETDKECFRNIDIFLMNEPQKAALLRNSMPIFLQFPVCSWMHVMVSSSTPFEWLDVLRRAAPLACWTGSGNANTIAYGIKEILELVKGQKYPQKVLDDAVAIVKAVRCPAIVDEILHGVQALPEDRRSEMAQSCATLLCSVKNPKLVLSQAFEMVAIFEKKYIDDTALLLQQCRSYNSEYVIMKIMRNVLPFERKDVHDKIMRLKEQRVTQEEFSEKISAIKFNLSIHPPQTAAVVIATENAKTFVSSLAYDVKDLLEFVIEPEAMLNIFINVSAIRQEQRKAIIQAAKAMLKGVTNAQHIVAETLKAIAPLTPRQRDQLIDLLSEPSINYTTAGLIITLMTQVSEDTWSDARNAITVARQHHKNPTDLHDSIEAIRRCYSVVF